MISKITAGLVTCLAWHLPMRACPVGLLSINTPSSPAAARRRGRQNIYIFASQGLRLPVTFRLRRQRSLEGRGGRQCAPVALQHTRLTAQLLPLSGGATNNKPRTARANTDTWTTAVTLHKPYERDVEYYPPVMELHGGGVLLFMQRCRPAASCPSSSWCCSALPVSDAAFKFCWEGRTGKKYIHRI